MAKDGMSHRVTQLTGTCANCKHPTAKTRTGNTVKCNTCGQETRIYSDDPAFDYEAVVRLGNKTGNGIVEMNNPDYHMRVSGFWHSVMMVAGIIKPRTKIVVPKSVMPALVAAWVEKNGHAVPKTGGGH